MGTVRSASSLFCLLWLLTACEASQEMQINSNSDDAASGSTSLSDAGTADGAGDVSARLDVGLPAPQVDARLVELPTDGSLARAACASAGVPVDKVAMKAFLAAGSYRTWPRETKAHTSGVHGAARTFLSPPLEASLKARESAHPLCVMAVKELYASTSATEPNGYAAMVKVRDKLSADAWYYAEFAPQAKDLDGDGHAACQGCHSLGVDYIRSQYPFN